MGDFKKMKYLFAALFLFAVQLLAQPMVFESEYFIDDLKVQRQVFELSGEGVLIVNLSIENRGESLANLELKEIIPKNFNLAASDVQQVDVKTSFAIVPKKSGELELRWIIQKISKGEKITLAYKISKKIPPFQLQYFQMPSIFQQAPTTKNAGKAVEKLQVELKQPEVKEVENKDFDFLSLIIGLVGIAIAAYVLMTRK